MIIFAIVLQKESIIRGIAVFVLFMMHCLAFSQDNIIDIQGKVEDEHDETGLDFSSVYIRELNLGMICDSLGSFSFKNIPTGTYTFRFSHIGCGERDSMISISQEHNYIVLYLEHHGIELEAVNIHSNLPSNYAKSENVSIVKSKEIKDPTADLGKMLSSVTGVNNLQSGPTIFKPIIQGMHSDRILILQNGTRLEGQSWGAEHAPEIDAASAQQLSVVKGAGSVQFGTDAMGGVVVLENDMREIATPLKGSIRYAFNSNNLSNGLHARLEQGYTFGTKNEFGWQIFGTFKKAADAKSPDYTLSNTAMQEQAAQAGIFWKNTGKFTHTTALKYSFYQKNLGIMAASHVGNLEDLNIALQSDRPLIINDRTFQIGNPRQKVTHHTLFIKSKLELKEKHVIKYQYDIQIDNRQEYDIRRGGRSDIPALDLQLNSHHAGLQYLYTFKNNLFKIGTDYYYRYNRNIPGTGIRPLIPDYINHGVSLWAFYQKKLKSWTTEVGARYEFQYYQVYKFNNNSALTKPVYAFNNFAALLGAEKQIHPIVHFSINAALASRSPNVKELFSEGLHQSAAAIEYGDSNLKSEKGIKLMQQWKINWNNKIRLDVSPYLNYINNYIYLQPKNETILTIRGAFPVYQYLQTNVLMGGIDADVSVFPGPDWLKIFAKYSLIRIHDLRSGQELINTPPGRITLGTGLEKFKWKKMENLYLDIEWMFVAKQFRVNPNIDFKTPPEDYQLLSIDAGLDIPMKNSHVFGFGISIDNLTNNKYRDYLDRFRYYADAQGINFQFKINYSF